MSWFRISAHGTRLVEDTEVRFNKAQDTANKRRRELEEKSDRRATETLEGDLKATRKQSQQDQMENGDDSAFLVSLTCVDKDNAANRRRGNSLAGGSFYHPQWRTKSVAEGSAEQEKRSHSPKTTSKKGCRDCGFSYGMHDTTP